MTREMVWRKVDPYLLQGDGYAIGRARCGDKLAYSLWRDARDRFSSPDLLRTITGVDPGSDLERLAAINELKAEAEAHVRA